MAWATSSLRTGDRITRMPPDQPTQRDLFEHRPAWAEDDRRLGTIATVVLPDGVDKPLDYLVPESLAAAVEPGRRVRVPLGRANRLRLAYCVAVRSGELPQTPLKEVAAVEDDKPLLSRRMLALTEWMAERWMARRGEVLEAVLPAGVRLRRKERVARLLVAGVVDPARKLTPAQARVLAAASQPATAEQLAQATGASRAVVTRLVKLGLLQEAGTVATAAGPARRAIAHDRPETLSPAQASALGAISAAMREGRHETIVLFGVTGSGKTEVYLQAVEETISYGRQAIVLVPEISLTPQTCDRFRARFGTVAVLHSHLTPAERHGQWREIAAGRVNVVVGARSAIFAPAPRLGLIVIDEEHESSFKQATAPRYHARDVAEWIAREEGVPLVLGSATPALETVARCLAGEWRMCRLADRVGGSQLPAVITVDLRDRSARSRGAISPRLAAGIRWALDAGGQVMLLLNRRGFATHVQCQACGHSMRCPQCEIALTLHQPGNKGVCHGCGLVTRLPADCPECRSPGLVHRGTGTQRLEEQVRKAFPDAAVARMDTDTMRSRGSHEKTLDAFRDRQIDILVGTQMIAKGLDFPSVMLVGVVNADAALHLADFRAAERTCQLVTQVSGRSGRGPQGGRVVVQTSTPDHPAVRAAAAHDYEAFVRSELPIREALLYPPFGNVIRLVVRGVDEDRVAAWAGTLAERLRAEAAKEGAGAGLRVLGPAPAPIPRLRERFRHHLQVHGPDGPALRALVGRATAGLKTPDGIAWIVDVDPVEML
jgi:primosomal protein N' (replication factor Y) (superfamily II helicase)